MEYTGVSTEAQARRIALANQRRTSEITITDEAMKAFGPLHDGMTVRLDAPRAPAGDYLLVSEPVEVDGGWQFLIREHWLDRDAEWNPEP